MAAASWTLYPCCLAFIFDLLSEILPVAIGAVPMSAFQSIRLQTRRVFTANITGEASDQLGCRNLGSVRP